MHKKLRIFTMLKNQSIFQTRKHDSIPSKLNSLRYVYRLVMISIKWSKTAQKNALVSADVIVTQLLRYHMPLLYFVRNHLI